MKLAFLYAGQGTQHPGMGRDLYETYPAFRQVLDSAQLDFDLKELCFEGPEEKLSQTQYTQPCMVAFAAGVTAVLREKGIIPEVAAGLSLGEYSALQAAGVFDSKTAVELVAFRGTAMAQAVPGRRERPSRSCWCARFRAASNWRTPSAPWRGWAWTPSWRSGRARLCPHL